MITQWLFQTLLRAHHRPYLIQNARPHSLFFLTSRLRFFVNRFPTAFDDRTIPSNTLSETGSLENQQRRSNTLSLGTLEMQALFFLP